MKIIDILNKKANKTLEKGFMFVYGGKVYKYDKRYDAIMNANSDRPLGYDYIVENILNDEVLLVEKESTNEDT